MLRALVRHWPEYLMEGAELGLFMVSAGLFGTLFEYPGSPVHRALPDPFVRHGLTGLAMGATAVAIIYSPWGKRSGAHFNPAVTLTFYRLGKVEPWDAVFYVMAQFAGALAGVLLAFAVLGAAFGMPPVSYVATLPGPDGPWVAFAAEVTISFFLMLTILAVTNRAAVARFTGLFAGALVALYIAFESPLSGMSMNPARTLGSALPGGLWTALWVYCAAPPLGMLLAAELYQRAGGRSRVRCAKLHHQNDKRCIFRCGYAAAGEDPAAPAGAHAPMIEEPVR
jgi:aquaporin Z